jgi:glycosyltransferase involved in cell wall biosynthesis
MAPYLEDTITSVIANLRAGDEYFVIDGGSTDGSVEIIKRYSGRISGWVSEPDAGYADAIAKGFSRATGDIQCWINASDIYLAGAFATVRKLLRDEIDMIYGDDFHIDENGRVLSYSRGWVPNLRSAMLHGGWAPLQDACFWRRGLYEKIGGIDPVLLYAADYDLFLRMSLVGKAYYVPVAFSAFRRHRGQKSIAGSGAYEEERRRIRKREIGTSCTNAISRGTMRVAMSARARLAPFIWRRPDLAGRNVMDLPSGRYWPADVAKGSAFP